MQLQYLDFDFSDEESGRASFDAMASVLPARLPALLAELAAVLDWATRTFGRAAALEEEGEWDYQLQAVDAADRPLPVRYDAVRGAVVLPAAAGAARITVTLTLTGSRGFCDALREAFALDA